MKTVSLNSFGKLAAFPVDGQIYAQPLCVNGVLIPSKGPKNVVYAVTMNNSVYAIDSDSPGTVAPLWQANLGAAVPSELIPGLTDINPQVGILSTPVIDLGRQAIYVVSETLEDSKPVFRMHALALSDGHEMLNGPVVITGSVSGSGVGSDGGKVNFDALWHLQRPGLALANGAVYVAFGSHGDVGPYHGWVMAYDAGNLKHQIAVFNTTPNGNAGGIWQSGRAPAVDESGNIYVISGNGDFDGNTNFGGAVIKLSGDKLAVLDWYTPAAWKYLNANDLDVGSTGGILVPGSSVLVTGDKGGRLINLSTDRLGHIENAPGADGFKASPAPIFQVSLWESEQGALVYQHDWHGPLKAYPVGSGVISQTTATQGALGSDSLYQGMVISSNGATDGIVWETTGDRSQPGSPGTLHAFNAMDLTQELWNSALQPGDSVGAFAKFATPLVANGRVYVPTFSNQLAIYGLFASEGETAPRITSVVNGGSMLTGPVSPGELIAIDGVNLGPGRLQSLHVDETGRVTNQVAGTQILFDGVAAPVLYTSFNQVGAVVPFGVNGLTTRVAVRSAGQQTAQVTLPVATSTPALFSLSGLGKGQGAILNMDGSVNSASNPAEAGTPIALFATGLGPSAPPGEDGKVAAGILPVPNLPVSVSIGGKSADVWYAGAAPGLVEGVFQINVRIPESTPSGAAIPVSVKAGDTASPDGITVAVSSLPAPASQH